MTKKEHGEWIERYDKRIDLWKKQKHPFKDKIIKILQQEKEKHQVEFRELRIKEILYS